MSIEGIPEGWELVRFDYATDGEQYLNGDGDIMHHLSAKPTQAKRLIIRKIEKPKRYRPFANAAEFEPHRDRWIRRSCKDDGDNNLTAGCFRVAAYDDDAIWTVDGETTSYEAVFKNGKKFTDGTPFGVEVTDD